MRLAIHDLEACALVFMAEQLRSSDGEREWSGATSLAEGNAKGSVGARWQPSMTRQMTYEPVPASILFGRFG